MQYGNEHRQSAIKGGIEASPRTVREAELAFYDATSLYGHESAEALVAERFSRYQRRLVANCVSLEQRRAEQGAKPPLRRQTGETLKQCVVAFECTLIALTLDEHAGRIQEADLPALASIGPSLTQSGTRHLFAFNNHLWYGLGLWKALSGKSRLIWSLP